MTKAEEVASQHPPDMAPDFTVPQKWENYTDEEHGTWDILYERQVKLLPGYAEQSFIDGLKLLDLGRGGIPKFDQISDELEKLTGWRIVAVPCLVPDDIFFDHLANRRFPAGNFIRQRDQLDYIQEPDVFHDIFGHVPLLANPVFADYMEAYGKGGLRSLNYDCLKNLAALYWYTVEFGLIKTPDGLRIYGAGIVSSASETRFSLKDASPNRLDYDLERVMRTDYRIDDFQQTYFVIDSYESLFQSTVDTDFGPLYERLPELPRYAVDQIVSSEEIIHQGTQAYANAGGRFAAE
ncbi:phenylalanine 4-monooxygenase [Parvularcula sp. IMCC14364]|uniref:phenylalanine 4-monooxygenase n=1 Tax=Parvularcula sp. IMCC14364 TaxID=3067902 RepID=UPI002740A15D|nr:phenylalanine 4-monooxygenase [Parvularcula sp. IMCC14364]